MSELWPQRTEISYKWLRAKSFVPTYTTASACFRSRYLLCATGPRTFQRSPYFAAKYGERMNKAVWAIPSETMEAMLSYNWPGNIRELQNFIERGVIISRGAVFEPDLDQLQHQKRRHCK